MSRKTLTGTIIILFVLVTIGVVGGYFYLTNTKQTPPSEEIDGFGSLVSEGDIQEGTGELIDNENLEGLPVPRLRQITKTPVAGYDFVDKGNGYVVWYVDRANGHISETSTSSLVVSRITNTTIPKVYEAHIGKGGENITLRMVNEAGNIETFIGSPKAKSSAATSSTNEPKELVGTLMGATIDFLSLSPLKDKFFGLVSAGLGAQGSIYPFKGAATSLFSHPVEKWIPQWVNTNTIVLTTAPSARAQNLSYILNTATKTLTQILGPKTGMVVSASPSANDFLFSQTQGTGLATGIFDRTTGTEKFLQNSTVPDKCAWSKINPNSVYCGFPKSIPEALYPDYWYQGRILFDDTIGFVNTETASINNILDLQEESGSQMDVINPMISKDDKYLLFTNKRDLTLWILEL